MDGLYEQFRIALHQVWQRRWLAVAVAWGLCLVGWLVIALIPNSYESKARVFVQMRQIIPSQTGYTPPVDRQAELLRVQQTMLSARNLERVVRRTELNSQVASERDLAREVEKLRQNIKIQGQLDGTIEIVGTSSVTGFSNAQNARTSTAIVQGLLDTFAEEYLAADRAETGQSLTFLDEELRRREGQLREAEQRRVEFEQRTMGLMPGEGSVTQRMSMAQSELAGIEQQIVAAQSSLSAMRAELGATPQTMPGIGGAAAAPGPASAQLATLEGQLAQGLARGWTDAHPEISGLRQQIERLRPIAAGERRSVGSGGGGMSNPAYVSLRSMIAQREAELSAAQARRARLQADLQQLGARQVDQPGLAAEQARLTRDYDVLKGQYDRLLENREQMRLRNEAQSRTQTVDFRVIQPPSQPTVPVAPNRPVFLTLVLFVAIAAGIAAAFVKGQLQTTFPTQGRLASVTGLPVLGTVTEVVTPSEKARRRQRLVWLSGSMAALAGSYSLLMVIEFWQRSTVA
jgi:polysaccharide chain length determinant protein (PEP-CTERM system associated)